MRARNERGITLTELSVVVALATVVMVGLIGFYFNSQAMWLDGSSQSVTQREATLLVETMRDSIHVARTAIVDTSNPSHHSLFLYDVNNNPLYAFWWDAGDSLIHEGRDLTDDRGAALNSIVMRFHLSTIDSNLVELQLLELRTVTGELVKITSSFALHNRP